MTSLLVQALPPASPGGVDAPLIGLLALLVAEDCATADAEAAAAAEPASG